MSEEDKRIADAFRAWYEDIKKSDIDEYASWYIKDRFQIILENLPE